MFQLASGCARVRAADLLTEVFHEKCLENHCQHAPCVFEHEGCTGSAAAAFGGRPTGRPFVPALGLFFEPRGRPTRRLGGASEAFWLGAIVLPRALEPCRQKLMKCEPVDFALGLDWEGRGGGCPVCAS